MTIYDLVSHKPYQYKHVLTKLIQYHTGINYKEIILHYDDLVSDATVHAIDSDYRSYAKDHKPLEYIMWTVTFLWNDFAIDHRAMIPRPETEYMIQAVIKWIDEGDGQTPVRILDLWCGCGVLWISVCLWSTTQRIVSLNARDISHDAVDLTQTNKEKYADFFVEHGIVFDVCVSNGLQELVYHPDLQSSWKRDALIIVCNYPYIPDDTFDQNADECAKKREPRMAFVWGEDGLDLYRMLLWEIQTYGLTHATLYLEMMTRQMDILEKEFWEIDWGEWSLEIVSTFHFNIIIVKVEHKG